MMAYSRYGFFFCHMASLSQSFLCCLDLSDTIRAKIKRPYPCCTFFAQVFITRLYIWFKVNACTNFRYWHIAKQCCFSMAKCTSFLFRDYSCYFMAHRCSFIKSPANVSAYSTHTRFHPGNTTDSYTDKGSADSSSLLHRLSSSQLLHIQAVIPLRSSSILSYPFPHLLSQSLSKYQFTKSVSGHIYYNNFVIPKRLQGTLDSNVPLFPL